MLMDKLNSSVKSEGPSFILEFNQQILDVIFSPYEWSHDVLCIAFTNKILVGSIKFQEEHEDDQLEEVDFECIEEFLISDRVHALCLSPETTLKDIPKNVILACALDNFTINVYNSSITDAYTVKVLNGHKNYVNSIAYESSGEHLASVSNDLTCRIWKKNEPFLKFFLCSPGMDVCWHPTENGKLLVGEKGGIVRMYNVWSGSAVLSLRTDLGPLMSIDLAPTNNLHIAALCGEYLVMWKISTPSSPSIVRSVHPQGGRKVRFSTVTDRKIATIGSPDNALKLFTVGKQYPSTIANLKMVYGLTWHQHLPYIAVGVDKNLFLWKIN